MRKSMFNEKSLPHSKEDCPFTLLAYEIRGLAYNRLKSGEMDFKHPLHPLISIPYDFLNLLHALREKKEIDGLRTHHRYPSIKGLFSDLDINSDPEQLCKKAVLQAAPILRRFKDQRDVQAILRSIDLLVKENKTVAGTPKLENV